MVKEHNLVIRIGKGTKEFYRKVADACGLSVTDLVLKWISIGKKTENERMEKIQKLASSLKSSITANL
jgi:hypothetical protein